LRLSDHGHRREFDLIENNLEVQLPQGASISQER